MGPPCSRQAAAPYHWLCLSLTLVLGELRSTVGMFVGEINIDMAADAESPSVCGSSVDIRLGGGSGY